MHTRCPSGLNFRRMKLSRMATDPQKTQTLKCIQHGFRTYRVYFSCVQAQCVNILVWSMLLCMLPLAVGRSGGNVPPQTVRPSSCKSPRVVIVVIVLGLFFSVLGISTVSASSHTSCDQRSFLPNSKLIGDSMGSTCTRAVALGMLLTLIYVVYM